MPLIVVIVSTIFAWPPKLAEAIVTVSPGAYPLPAVVAPTVPDVDPGCPTSLRTRTTVNSAPVPTPEVAL